MTLDRADNNGNYCPENCRWVDYVVQANNRENSIKLEIDGVSKTYTEWAETLGVDKKLFASRMRKGWDIESAITEKKHEAKTYEYNGETHTSAGWSKRNGWKNKRLVSYRVERQRWSVEKAVTTPPGKQGQRRKNNG